MFNKIKCIYKRFLLNQILLLYFKERVLNYSVKNFPIRYYLSSCICKCI